MSDIPTKTVERHGITFGKLTARDRAAILNQQKAKRKAELSANLDAAGIGGEEKFNELEAFDLTPRGLDDFVNYVNTMDGQLDVLLRGIRKGRPEATEAEVDDLPLTTGETMELAAEIAGLTLRFANPESEAEPQEPRPSEDVYTAATT